MKRLAALSLTLALSTPAAAVTVSMTSFQAWYRLDGTSTAGFHIGLQTTIPGLPTLEPANGDYTKYGGYDLWFDDFYYLTSSGIFYGGSIFGGRCFSNYSTCEREISGPVPRPELHVGDLIRFDYFWSPYGVLAGLPYPEAFVNLGDLPSGVSVTATQSPFVPAVPLPASWLLFGSLLGLGGLLRRWRRA